MREYTCPVHGIARVVRTGIDIRCIDCDPPRILDDEPTPIVPRSAFELPHSLPSTPTPIVPPPVQPVICPRCGGSGGLATDLGDREIIDPCPVCKQGVVTRAQAAAWRPTAPKI